MLPCESTSVPLHELRQSTGLGAEASLSPTDPSLGETDDGGVTLRPGAKALVITPDGAVLVVEERRRDGSTFWTLPGGGLEVGESPGACLRRELREELDCGVSIGSPLAVCSYRHTRRSDTRSRYAVFRCSLRGKPTPVRDEGVVGIRWVPPSAPPDGILDPFRELLESLADGIVRGPREAIGSSVWADPDRPIADGRKR